jgi:hypothetical protein
MSMSQGEAVYVAVSEIFYSYLDEGRAVPETTTWTSKQKEEVYARVFSMFKTGETTHKKNPSDAELLKYIPGLVNNWVRKDKRLNGNTVYTPRNPGSRQGGGDEQLREMKKLLTLIKDPAQREMVEAAITERIAATTKKVEIKVEALPEALRHLVK